MNFLAPIFLAGLAAIAAPILWHLIRRRPKETAPFPTLMFLEPTPPRMTKRSRLEDLFLLLLRVLLLALVALAFARPYFGRPGAAAPAKSENRKVLVLVDVSASMQRAGIWDAALNRAEAALRELGAGDAGEIWVFDETVRNVVGAEKWKTGAVSERVASSMAALRKEKPGWNGTALGRTLVAVVENLESSKSSGGNGVERAQVVLISDFQSGAQLDGLAGHNWPKGLEVKLASVAGTKTGNASIHWLGEGRTLATNEGSGGMKVRVQNHQQSKAEQFQIGWARAGSSVFSGKPATVQVPPGQSRTVVPPAMTGEGDSLWLEGDDVVFDNRLYRVLNEEEVLRVLATTDETGADGGSMLYFLRRALLETTKQKVSLIHKKGSDAIPSSELAGARSLVLMEPAAESAWKSAGEFLAAGKTVIVGLRSASSAPVLARLLGVENVAMSEAAGEAIWSRLDWEHPILTPFADPRFSDFTRIRFWKHRKLDLGMIPGSRAIAWFDQGDPAIVVVPVKEGRAVLFTAGWHTEDSQFALSSKFVPLLYRILEWSGVLVEQPGQFLVGAEIPVGEAKGRNARRWITPAGIETNLDAAVTAMRAEQPGIYQLVDEGKPRRFAVNLVPAESRVEPMPEDELERLGVPVRAASDETKTVSAMSSEKRALQEAVLEIEGRQKGWRWFLIAAMVLFALETVVAGWIGRRSAAVA